MQNAGYLSQKKRSPTGLMLVVLAHAGVLGALVLAKGPEIMHPDYGPIEVTPIPIPPEPPIDPPPPDRPRPQPTNETMTTVLPPFIPPMDDGPISTADPPRPPDPIPDPVVTRTEPPFPRPVSPRRARANLGSYFSTDDYPAAALRAEAEGRTGFSLTIGLDGRITNCTVTSSSGNSALDGATCRILRARARYTPARDQNDNPVSGTDRGSITWRLPSN